MSGIIVDTNVVSEPRRWQPDANVAAWLAAQDPERLFLTATVVGELAFGVATLPHGRRRSAFELWLRDLVRERFAGRILAYDADAALIYGGIVAAARAQGREPKIGDAQVAAVARREGMAVATRNIGDFELLGVEIIDPWRTEASAGDFGPRR
jgi:predicted nucleic acid-binding protein